MLKKVVLLYAATVGLMPSATIANTQFDPNSVYADQPGKVQKTPQVKDGQPPAEKDQSAVIILDLQTYQQLGNFDIPQGVTRPSIMKFNSKIFILSEQPDKRLAGLWIGRDSSGREGLCGHINNSMRIQKCYYILYREK